MIVPTARPLILITVVLGFSVAAPAARAQDTATITGRVVDAETNRPVPGVNVYLAHTLRGAATDVDGRYAIDNVPPGSYELVASIIGYAARTVPVEVLPGARSRTLDFRLPPQVYDLDAVEVTARRSRDWAYRFREFEELFLGASVHAKETEILNAYVLSFEIDPVTRVFTALAVAPLEIENRALGYRLSFVLRQFRWDPHREQLIVLGLPRFEAMVPEDDEQAREWADNRAEAFQGSLPHLLRAMIAGRTFEEGFQLQLREPTYTRAVTAEDLLQRREGSPLYELSFNGTLYVHHQGRTGRGGFLRRKSRELAYRVYLNTYAAFVGEDGHLAPAGAAGTYQYPKRVADLLPREYGLAIEEPPGPAPAARAQVEVDLAPLRYTQYVLDERRAGTPEKPKPEALQRALTAMQDDRWERAADALDGILEDDPEHLEARYYRAICAREIARAFPYHEEAYRPAEHYEDRWTKAVDRFEELLGQDSLYRDVVYQYALLWRYAQQYERALDLGHAQVRLRPEFEHARHGLFQIYRAYVFDRTSRAVEGLADRETDLARYFHGEALRLSGDPDAAESALQDLLDRVSDIPRQPIYLSLARIAYARGSPEQARAYVEAAIAEIDTKLAADLVFDDVKYLVDEEELAAYRSLDTTTAYRAFFQTFWQRRDPAPSLSRNERMAEHYRRLLKAEREYVYLGVQTRFTIPDETLRLAYPAAYALNEVFNDKGLIYLRHGEPDDVISAVNGTMETRTAVDAGALGGEEKPFLDRLWIPIEKSFQQDWMPNESWRYHNPRMDFHFVLEGSGSNWRLTPLLPLELGILENREDWGGTYAEMVREARVFQQQRAEAAEKVPSDEGFNPNAVPRILEVQTIADRMVAESRETVARALDTDRHTWSEEIRPLDVPFLAAAFRGDDGRTRLEIHYALPTGAITRKTDTHDDSLRVELGLALHDIAWQPRTRHARPLAFPATDDPDVALTGTLAIDVPPDSYHVALHARPVESALLGAYRFDKRLPDFARPELMISDLLPAYRVTPQTDALAPKRPDFRIVPNPYRRFATNEPVHLYFELYNLTYGADDRTHYTLEYTLRPLEQGRILGVIPRDRAEVTLSLQTDREGAETSPVEYAEIDVSRVPAGRYALSVTVTDRQTGRSATQAIPVELVRP